MSEKIFQQRARQHGDPEFWRTMANGHQTI